MFEFVRFLHQLHTKGERMLTFAYLEKHCTTKSHPSQCFLFLCNELTLSPMLLSGGSLLNSFHVDHRDQRAEELRCWWSPDQRAAGDSTENAWGAKVPGTGFTRSPFWTLYY